MKKLVKEFRDFIARGNVVDMAVGVIIATAFGKITTSLINDVFMPFISYIFGTRDMTALNLVVRPEIKEIIDGVETVVQTQITIGFGNLVATIIDFLLIGLVVFMVVKAINTARALTEKKKEEEPAPAPAEPEPTKEELLLTEIRDLLKEKN